ncbi:hypothetical protein GVAV_002148 [Gurleya vavrai]
MKFNFNHIVFTSFLSSFLCKENYQYFNPKKINDEKNNAFKAQDNSFSNFFNNGKSEESNLLNNMLQRPKFTADPVRRFCPPLRPPYPPESSSTSSSTSYSRCDPCLPRPRPDCNPCASDNFYPKRNFQNDRLCRKLFQGIRCCTQELQDTVNRAIAMNSREFLSALNQSLTDAGANLSAQISSLNTALGNTISDLSTSNNLAQITAVQNLITNTNADLLVAIENSIAIASNATAGFVQNLATLTPAVIVSTVQNLTLPGGLLPTLLVIYTALEASVVQTFANTTPAELIAVSNILNQSSAQLQSSVANAITASNLLQVKAVNDVFASQITVLSRLFNQFVFNVLESINRAIKRNECCVEQAVRTALCCDNYKDEYCRDPRDDRRCFRGKEYTESIKKEDTSTEDKRVFYVGYKEE